MELFHAFNLVQRAAGTHVPLTALQLQKWDHVSRGVTQRISRLAVASARILGPLNATALRESLASLVQRHESLRTRIVSIDGVPAQDVAPNGGVYFEVIDLAKTPVNDIEGEAKRLVQELMDATIDLSVGPLFEGKLLCLSPTDHVLVLAIDHIVSDAASCEILNAELWTLYSQVIRGRSPSLPKLSVQFADYAVWQRRTYGDWIKNHEAYWRGRLTGAPRMMLRRDEGSDDTERSTATLHYPLGKKLTATLREVAASESTRLSSLILTIYAAVMAKWLNQSDLVLAFITHGRHLHPDLQNMVGFLANHLMLRIEIDARDSFLSLLDRISSELRSAYQHYDFGRVQRLFPEGRSQLVFNWMTVRSSSVPMRNDNPPEAQITVRPFPVRTRWPVSFYPFFYETPSGITVTVAYRSNLFAKTTVDQFGQNFRSFAAHCGQNPRASVASVMGCS